MHQDWTLATRGLAKYGYKTNREVKNLEILLHVDEPLEPNS